MEAAVAEKEAGMTEWNDGRLDELTKKIDDGFALQRQEFQRVDRKFEQAEQKADARFEQAEKKADARFEQAERKAEAGFDRLAEAVQKQNSQVNTDIRFLSSRFDKLQHALMQISLGFAAGLATTWLALIVKAL